MKKRADGRGEAVEHCGVDWNLRMRVFGVEAGFADFNKYPDQVNRTILALDCLKRALEKGARFMMREVDALAVQSVPARCTDCARGLMPFQAVAGHDMSGAEIECPDAPGALRMDCGIDFGAWCADAKTWRDSFRKIIAECGYWQAELLNGWRQMLMKVPGVDRAERRQAQAAFELLAAAFDEVLEDGSQVVVEKFKTRLERFEELYAMMMMPGTADGAEVLAAVRDVGHKVEGIAAKQGEIGKNIDTLQGTVNDGFDDITDLIDAKENLPIPYLKDITDEDFKKRLFEVCKRETNARNNDRTRKLANVLNNETLTYRGRTINEMCRGKVEELRNFMNRYRMSLKRS